MVRLYTVFAPSVALSFAILDLGFLIQTLFDTAVFNAAMIVGGCSILLHLLLLKGKFSMTKILTLEQVAEIKARAEAAIEGPYQVIEGSEYLYTESATVDGIPLSLGFIDTCFFQPEQSEATRQFIAHARTDIPALCDTVEELRKQASSLHLMSLAHQGENNKFEALYSYTDKGTIEDLTRQLAEAREEIERLKLKCTTI